MTKSRMRKLVHETYCKHDGDYDSLKHKRVGLLEKTTRFFCQRSSPSSQKFFLSREITFTTLLSAMK